MEVTPPATVPASSGTTVTVDDNGGGDGLDNGSQAAVGVEAFSPVVTLTSGSETITEAMGGGAADDTYDSSGDMTVDFGFYTPMSIGSLVFLDEANDGSFTNGTDSPLEGAVVTLYKADGTTPATDAFGLDLHQLDCINRRRKLLPIENGG